MERYIIRVAILGFVLHLLLIALVHLDFLHPKLSDSDLLSNYISAIYTPFSFILIYEVYLLVFYLPKSITVYIGKQYEIVSLIVVRRIFKDMANISFQPDWFANKYNLQLAADTLCIVGLYALIFVFYYLGKRPRPAYERQKQGFQEALSAFIRAKKIVSWVLVPVLMMMAGYSFFSWALESTQHFYEHLPEVSNVNEVFYHDFFTLLILIDVLLLLISFRHTEEYSQLIRNSGFILSTIMIKLSFSASGLLNTVLVLSAVGFGVLMLLIFNLYRNGGEGLTNPASEQNTP
jgi:hypothetical protein